MDVVFLPHLSETFHRLKTFLVDDECYDTKETAVPHFLDFSVSGSGFTSGEVITVDINDELITGTATIDGTVVIPIYKSMSYDQTNIVKVSQSDGTVLARKYFDTYKFLTVLYVLSLEYLKALNEFGQSKQDIFVDPLVGDAVTTARSMIPINVIHTIIVIIQSRLSILYHPAVSAFNQS